MKQRFDIKSLKVQLWLYFILFGVLIVGTLWLLQFVFINTYFPQMKASEVKSVAAKIAETYKTSGFAGEMKQAAIQNGVVVQVTDQNGVVIQSADMMGGDMPMTPPQGFFSPALSELKQSQSGTVTMTVPGDEMGKQTFVYGKALMDSKGGKDFLFVASPASAVNSTTRILQGQMLYISIILLALAFGIAYLISRRIAKPITKLTNTAGLLAQGDYGVKFDKGSYSEINKLSNTLNFATKEISRVDELRKDLIANVSHDLRTPLTMIKAYAEMVRDLSGQNPKKREDHLNVIIAETDRLSTLVNDILDLSKIQSGTETLHIQPFNLSRTVRGMMQRYAILTEQEGYTFHIECPDDIHAMGDERRIEQVIYNLVNNAINYTGEDKKVYIKLKDLGGSIRFEVQDTGCGIAEEELPSIWERYYKTDKTHKRAVVGTGLGLSIVKSILEQHAAKYGAESKEGEGATFWFEIDKGRS